MDFLLTFRLYGPPRDILTYKSQKTEDIMRANVYVWFILLSGGKKWTLLQYTGLITRYAITTYVISFLGDDCMDICRIICSLLDLFYVIDFVSSFLHWIHWHRNQGELTKEASVLKRVLWKNKAHRPRPLFLLILDFISILPLEFIGRLYPHRHPVHIFFHTLCLIRIYRVFFIFNESGFQFSLSINVLHILLKFFVISVVFMHSYACMWYTIQNEETETSLYKAQDKIDFNVQSPTECYLIAYYYVQTTYTNVGFGDIAPENDMERAFSVFLAMFGFCLIYGYVVGALSSVFLEQARRVTNLSLRLSLIQSELALRKVPVEIHKKVMKFYYALLKTRKGAGSTDDMLNEMPPSLSIQVYYDIFSAALNASLLFRSCDDYSKRAIARVMSIDLYMAGDVILKRSEKNNKMFYIRKGTIQIMSYQDDETEIMTFGAGTIFGQCSLLLTLPSKSEVHAATFCEIHTLNRRDLFLVLIDYPHAKEIIMSVHKNLILNMLADKFETTVDNIPVPQENVLGIRSFYKVPLEAAKLGRDDVCIITTFPYIYMPDTIFLKVWYIFHGCLIMLISFYYPYCAAFRRTYPEDDEALILLVDIAYFFDIYLTLFTAVNKENILLSTGRQIAKERLSHITIYLDIFASLPYHYFIPSHHRVKPVVLCMRCIQIYKIPILFARAEYHPNRIVVNALRLLKYILYFTLGAYGLGVIFYMQACFYEECDPTSWYEKYPVTQYTEAPVITSMYFAAMILSGTGYGDITPRNVKDVIWVLSFMSPGIILICYLISEYSAHLSLAREPRQNFIELAERVMSFLRNNKMLPSERIRVRQFLNLQWEHTMGYEFVYGRDLLFDSPPHIYYLINLQSRCKGLRELEPFRELGENVINAMLKSSVRRIFPPHEVVIYAGEMCSSIIFLEEGYCEITYGRDVSWKKVIGPGENLCTAELFLGLTAMYHVRTLTHCVIVKLRKNDIRRALALNPLASRELETAIHNFKQSTAVKEFRVARPVRLHLAVRPTLQKSIFRFKYYQKQHGNIELRKPYAKLGICQCIRFFLRQMTVLPYGQLLKRWELVRCVFAFLSALLFPPLPYLELQVPALRYVGWFLDVTAWVDLYFRMHVCYYNDHNILVTHPLWTCSHYLKGSFVLDFLFCFPFDRILHRRIYDSNGETQASEVSIDILRMMRVGQVHRIPATLMRLGTDALSSPNALLVITMQTAFTIVFMNIFASMLILFTTNYLVKADGTYRIEFSDEQMENHMMQYLEIYNLTTDPFNMYLLNFYWTAMTSCTIGFGDITATTSGTMLFVLGLILASYLYFNYITIVIASHLSSINLYLTLYQKRLNHLIKFLKSENIEPMLKQHIINHFEYVWKKSRGMEGEIVFANFNLALKDDVMLHLYEETLRDVPAFQNLDPSFFRIVSSRLKEVYYQSGASVYKRGDIIASIYIIHQGEVTLVGNKEDQTAILWRSRLFGHLEMSERSISQVSAVATKNLHILSISTIELYELLESIHVGIAEGVESNQKTMANLSLPPDESEDPMDASKMKKDILGSKTIWFTQTSYKFSKITHAVYMIVAFISVNLVSYHLAFQNNHLPIAIVSIIIEILYILKIYIGFYTGYIDNSGEFVSDLKVIRRRYLRLSGFYLDFFTIIPFELLAFIAPSQDRLFVATALRMTKILRLYEIWRFFNSKADTLNVNMLLLKLVSIGVAIAIIYHQCSCGWFMVVCPRANCPNSRTYQYLTLNGKAKFIYLGCLYYSNVILTTTGNGDLIPQTVPEILFTICMAFLARIYAAAYIGQMVSTIQKSLYARTKYSFEMESLKNYLTANDVTPALRKNILNYATNLWINEKGYQIPELLPTAPKYINTEIKVAAYSFHINRNPIFENCDANFRKQLISYLNRTVYFPGNIIVHKGEVNGTAYFVHSGQVGFKPSADGSKTTVVENFFGLAQGVRRGVPHTHTYFARSICIILTLSLNDWESIIEFYPQEVLQLYKAIGKLHAGDDKNPLES